MQLQLAVGTCSGLRLANYRWIFTQLSGSVGIHLQCKLHAVNYSSGPRVERVEDVGHWSGQWSLSMSMSMSMLMVSWCCCISLPRHWNASGLHRRPIILMFRVALPLSVAHLFRIPGGVSLLITKSRHLVPDAYTCGTRTLGTLGSLRLSEIPVISPRNIPGQSEPDPKPNSRQAHHHHIISYHITATAIQTQLKS